MKKQKFKIEKKIPIPSANKKGEYRGLMYPFLEMKVGDSFFVKGKIAQKLTSIACGVVRNRGLKMKFISRTVKNGARIWRVK